MSDLAILSKTDSGSISVRLKKNSMVISIIFPGFSIVSICGMCFTAEIIPNVNQETLGFQKTTNINLIKQTRES